MAQLTIISSTPAYGKVIETPLEGERYKKDRVI